MGCLNSEGQFKHWFSNIHFSGKCNRSCYFCIGQHMMALDSIDVLDTFPLPNLDKFIDECNKKNVNEVNVTGSNTDPLLYRHLPELKAYLKERIPNLIFGIRTNGVLIASKPELWGLFDKGSISITSTDPVIYKNTMGQGKPPDLKLIKEICYSDEWTGPKWDDVKINIVLCPELFEGRRHPNYEEHLFEDGSDVEDLFNTIYDIYQLGIKRINIREPYGQPHLGDRFLKFMEFYSRSSKIRESIFGMPRWELGNNGCEIVYWDIHYVEVESVNLYANGEISLTYPVTKGHDPINGKVEGQEYFNKSGRVREQWVNLKVKK